MDKIITTWAALYDKLWSETLTSIADGYQITYSELKALIKEHHIPAPPNGYWSKLKAGYRIEKTPPPAGTVLEKAIEFTPKERRKKKVPVAKMESTVTIKPGGKLDPLVEMSRKAFRQQKGDYYKKYISYLGGDSLRIRATNQVMERAIAVFDLFIKHIKAVGGSILLNGSLTMAKLKDEDFVVSIREKNKRMVNPHAKYSYDKYMLVPAGILVFKIGSHSYDAVEWTDGKRQLEEYIPDIVEWLLKEAESRKSERIEDEKRRTALELQRQRERELEVKRQAEFNKLNQLIFDAERLRKSQLIRQYLTQLENVAKQNNTYNDSTKDFIRWGREKADWLDPLMNRPDELLDDVNKSTLAREKKSFW